MADGHLQRHEPAIAVAEHEHIVFSGSVPHRLGHPVGDAGKACIDRPGFAEARQLGNDHPERLRQSGNDGVETRPVRQQRMKQEKQRPLAGLRRIDGAVGEKSVHAEIPLGWKVCFGLEGATWRRGVRQRA